MAEIHERDATVDPPILAPVWLPFLPDRMLVIVECDPDQRMSVTVPLAVRPRRRARVGGGPLR
jgi:hypothetical protein